MSQRFVPFLVPGVVRKMRGAILPLAVLVGCAQKGSSSSTRVEGEQRSTVGAVSATGSTGNSSSPGTEPARRVALTFDDLGATRASSDLDTSRKILKALAGASAPSAVFANCKELTAEALRLWQAEGATVGNHSATHLSVDTTTESGEWEADRWWKDVSSCDARLRELTGGPIRYFRFPYLRYGTGEDRRRFAAEKLASLGYRVAHVSAATSEWLLAQYYETASARADGGLANDLATAYVEHMVDTLRVAREMGQRKTGGELAQITLIHVNRLAADHFGRVIDALRRGGWQFISLAEALADPVYARPDAYAGGCGCSWLARIRPALKPSDDYPFGDYEKQIRRRFEKRVAALGPVR